MENNELIKQYLESIGFTHDGDKLTRLNNVPSNQVIINGQVHQEYAQVLFEFEYIGDGWIGDEENNEELFGYKLHVNKNDAGDFWVRDLDEFKEFIRI